MCTKNGNKSDRKKFCLKKFSFFLNDQYPHLAKLTLNDTVYLFKCLHQRCFLNMSFYLMSIYLSIMYVCLCVCLFVCWSFFVSVYLYVCQYIFVSDYLNVCLFSCLSIFFYVFSLSVLISVYLYV